MRGWAHHGQTATPLKEEPVVKKLQRSGYDRNAHHCEAIIAPVPGVPEEKRPVLGSAKPTGGAQVEPELVPEGTSRCLIDVPPHPHKIQHQHCSKRHGK